MKRDKRCFALFSGGLDSVLSAKYMSILGYDVLPIFFETPFFKPDKAIKSAKMIGLNLIVHDLTEVYISMLAKPRYGYGKNMNPCIDCHGMMFRTAGELMEEYNVDFLISGEVLGQRPMSQRKDAMNSVGKLSLKKDLLVRPLSQKLLADSLPIREGWVDKNEMLDIQGRARYRQIDLAAKLGIHDFENPGGGCLLTDIGYGMKVKDLFEHDVLELKYIKLLSYGRHFRINPNLKLIVGKNENDNDNIEELITDETVMLVEDFAGPLAVLQANAEISEKDLEICANILLRYSSQAPEEADINFGLNHELINTITATKMSDETMKKYKINKG